MPCLRHLYLAVMRNQARCARIILGMLRENGGLHSIVVEEVLLNIDGEDVQKGLLFDDVELRLSEAYCLRNQHLAQLLEHETESGHSQPNSSDRARQALYPTLLQAAKQIPKSRLLLPSSSLAQLGDCIGPDSIQVAR
jgi:hypothetical protein